MILIVSAHEDTHALAVRERLADAGAPCELLNLSDFPQRLRLSLNYSSAAGADFHLLRADGSVLPLAECHTIWWRRPQPFVLHKEIREPDYCAFAYTETSEAWAGLWSALDVFWVNHPVRNEQAARKAHQLKLAQEIGFEIPATLITNDPQSALAFITRQSAEQTIYKAFSATIKHWRETRLLKSEELSLLDNIRFAPVIFQEYIPAQVDLRITVVGEEIFPAAIYSQESSYQVDYRMDMEAARVEPFPLPAETYGLIQTLMARLGLAYAAIDMRLTPEGRFVFLEVNPAGQWLFIEQRTAQPITASFAELLLRNRRGQAPSLLRKVAAASPVHSTLPDSLATQSRYPWSTNQDKAALTRQEP